MRAITFVALVAAVLFDALAPPRVRGFCWDQAAQMYRVPVEWLWAIAKVESNYNPNAVNDNKNGSRDVGLMQINSSWKTVLGERGWHAVQVDPCYNVMVGAWVLRDCVDRYGFYSWESVGCYNAVNRGKRAKYATKVIPVIEQAVRYSEARKQSR